MDRDEEAARRENVRRSYYQRFSDQGEESVRADLANRVLRGREARWAQDWIDSLDAEREAALRAEESSLARRATLAAEAAVEQARIANSEARSARRTAHMANAIAVIALMTAIAALISDIKSGS